MKKHLVICGDESMQYVMLGEVIQSAKSDRCGNDDYPVLSITKGEGIILQSNKFKKRIASQDTSQYKVVCRGQLVQGIHIDEANFGIQDIVDAGIVSPAYKVWNVDSSIINPKYLEEVLRSPRSIQYYASNFNGSIKRRERLSDKDFLAMKIPCPLMEEQEHVLLVIQLLRNIILARKQEISKMDELIKARFVEMFREYEWSTTVGNYIAELRGGKSLAGTEPCKNKVLKTGAATFGWFDPEQYKYLPQDYEPLPEHKVEAGDVMISRMNTPDLVGACSYVFEAPEDMYYPDRLWKVIPKNQANPIFIWQLLWDPEIRRQIKEKSGGTSGTMHNISKPKLLEIKCINVSVKEQNKFANFVKQIDKSKSHKKTNYKTNNKLAS